MRYPRYVWITLGWYPDFWWTQGTCAILLNHFISLSPSPSLLSVEVAGRDPRVTCSDDELRRMLEYSLVINNLPTADDIDATTDVGLVSEREGGKEGGRYKVCVLNFSLSLSL